jgi:hypothetical protein
MKAKLKIRPAEVPPHKAKISFNLPEPTIAAFHAYLVAYEALYGTKASPDFIVNEILTVFFASDKQFMDFIKKGNAETVVSP